jgi:hypothetical protein
MTKRMMAMSRSRAKRKGIGVPLRAAAFFPQDTLQIGDFVVY